MSTPGGGRGLTETDRSLARLSCLPDLMREGYCFDCCGAFSEACQLPWLRIDPTTTSGGTEWKVRYWRKPRRWGIV